MAGHSHSNFLLLTKHTINMKGKGFMNKNRPVLYILTGVVGTACPIPGYPRCSSEGPDRIPPGNP